MAETLYAPEGDAPAVKDAPITHATTLPDGIYFGLPEDDYHAAFALSASGIKHLRVSAENFWEQSTLNTEATDDDDEEPDDKESFARILGRAYHKRIVEGRDAFVAVYGPMLRKRDYPHALVTADDIKGKLKDLGHPHTFKTKAEGVERLLGIAPQAEIWDRLVDAHRHRMGDRTLLPFKYIKKIEIAAAMIENDPELGKAFVGGMPEVSVFWHDENGIPHKSRLDYVKTKAVVDLKTFENFMGREVKRAIAAAIASLKYHIQMAEYFHAIRAAKEHIRNGDIFIGKTPFIVHSDAPQAPAEACPPVAWLTALAKADDPVFLFVFQQKGAPVTRGYSFGADHYTVRLGETEIESACELFLRMWKAHGAGRWVDPHKIETITAEEFPAYIID